MSPLLNSNSEFSDELGITMTSSELSAEWKAECFLCDRGKYLEWLGGLGFILKETELVELS